MHECDVIKNTHKILQEESERCHAMSYCATNDAMVVRVVFRNRLESVHLCQGLPYWDFQPGPDLVAESQNDTVSLRVPENA